MEVDVPLAVVGVKFIEDHEVTLFVLPVGDIAPDNLTMVLFGKKYPPAATKATRIKSA